MQASTLNSANTTKKQNKTLNPEPQTPNPKPQTPNPKPQTLNPKPLPVWAQLNPLPPSDFSGKTKNVIKGLSECDDWGFGVES